jgi:3-keto-5-aminohexanoate cleavage enzyme
MAPPPAYEGWALSEDASGEIAFMSTVPESDPVAICVAPNGARRTKADHPALPMTAAELAVEAAACAAAGAGVMHLHVRDAAGGHSLDPGLYREAIAAIRAKTPDLIVQVTTEAVGRYTPAEQMAVVDELRPQAVSLALRELAPTSDEEPAFAAFLERTRRRGCGVQFVVYSPQEALRLAELARRGVCAEAEPHALFVLGRYSADMRSSPRDLLPFLEVWDGGWPWTLCAFGALESQCLAGAVALGGHLRVGFENNLLRPDGEAARDNADRVANVAALAAAAGRPAATGETLRRLYRVGESAGR